MPITFGSWKTDPSDGYGWREATAKCGVCGCEAKIVEYSAPPGENSPSIFHANRRSACSDECECGKCGKSQFPEEYIPDKLVDELLASNSKCPKCAVCGSPREQMTGLGGDLFFSSDFETFFCSTGCGLGLMMREFVAEGIAEPDGEGGIIINADTALDKIMPEVKS